LLLTGAGCGLAETPIPGTMPGQIVRAWIDALNSGDQAKIKEYVDTTDPSQSVDGMISLRNQTGGLDLLSVESSAAQHIRFRVKQKFDGTTMLGNLLVRAGPHPTVEFFTLTELPPGVALMNVTVDAALRKRLIEGVGAELEDLYVDPALARRMREAIQFGQNLGAYDATTDGDVLAAQVTTDLRAVSHDLHLNVSFNSFQAPSTNATPEDTARAHQRIERDNCGFKKLEVLPGNIGYVKLDEFMDAEFCGPTVTASMRFVAHTDAIIFDLRENHGGEQAMVTLLASYLFAVPTHLNDIYNRKEDSTQEFWTLPDVPGERISRQPVFVLTSRKTFSAAEAFSYDLKIQKRATIVGETTRGGAHPVRVALVADYFTVRVPFAKAINPVSKANWEGVGVAPDISVAAEEALTTAIKMAMEEIHLR
jgi:retinol-binding protein 3